MANFTYLDSVVSSEEASATGFDLETFVDNVGSGTVGAVTSGLLGMYNTGISLGTSVGVLDKNDVQHLDTYQKLQDLGWNDTADYYKQNKDALDVAGFIATSLIPGTIGVKVAKALQAGKVVAGAEVATGLNSGFAGKYIAQAEQIIAHDSTYAAATNLQSRIALGSFAQAAYENVAFTTAVLATSNQNPTINKEQLGYFDSIWANKGEYVSGMFLGFTALQGAIDTTRAFGRLNKLISAADKERALDLIPRQVGAIGQHDGDSLVYLADNLGKQYKLLEAGNLTGRSLTDKLASIQEYKTQMGLALAKISGDNPEIIQAAKSLMKVESSTDVQEVVRSLQGVVGIHKLNPLDAPIEGLRAYPVKIGDEEQLREWGKFAKQVELSDALGAASYTTDKIFLRVRESFGMNAEQGNKAMLATFLHETGHLDTKELVLRAAQNDNYLKGIMKDLVEVSRIRRSDRWAALDDLVKAAAKESDPVKAAELTKRASQLDEYLNKPTELLADAAAYFKGLGLERGFKAKQYKQLHDALDGVGALGETFGNVSYLYDSMTGAKSMGKVVPQLSDIYRLDVDTTTGALLRKGTDSIKVADLEFNPLTMTTTEADAQFAFWELATRKGKINPMADVIDEANLPKLQAAINQISRLPEEQIAGAKIQFKIKDIEAPVPLDLPSAINELERGKRAWATKLAENSIQVDSKITWQDIQRRLNVDEMWAIHKGIGGYTGNANVYGSIAPDAVRHVRVELARDAALDLNDVRTMQEVNNRINARIEVAQKAAHFQLGEDFEQFHFLKNSSPLDEASPVADVTSVSKTASFFGAANADYGTFGATSQAVGKLLHQRYLKMDEKISSEFATEAYGLLNDPAARAEFNVFYATKARQHWYEAGSTLEEAVNATDALSAEIAEWAKSVKGTEQYMINRAAVSQLESFFEKFTAGELPVSDWKRVLDSALSKPDMIVPIENTKTMQFIKTWIARNDQLVLAKQNFANVQGRSSTLKSGVFYAPPRDVRNAPYVAFVKKAEAEGIHKLEAVGAVVANTAEELERKIAIIKENIPDSQVFRKAEMADYQKTLGEYEAQKDLLEARMDSSLRRMGVLNEVTPRSDNLYLEEMLNYAKGQQRTLDRQAVKTLFANEIAELEARSNLASVSETSRFGFTAFKRKKEASNPWESTINQMLDISEYQAKEGAWRTISEKLDSSFSAIYHTVSQMLPAKPNAQAFEQINKYMETMGMQPAYKTTADLLLADSPVQRAMLQPLVSKVNAIVGKLMVGIDTMNALTNIVSLPVLMGPELRSLRKHFATKELDDLTTVAIPGSNGQAVMPSTMKLLGNAVANFTKFKTSNLEPEVVAMYDRLGLTGKSIKIVNELIDQATIPGKTFDRNWVSRASEAIDTKVLDPLAKISGTQLAEEFVRFVAGDTARQMVQAAGLPKSQWAPIINTFVNRVHGNRIASQKPLAFQGVLGQAIGLFQTYQFNLIQQMFKNVADGNTGYAKLLVGLQGTIFGMQGLPGFHALNQAIGERNRENRDIISTVYDVANREAGDWLVYGLASNVFHLDLYNRGDINPRSPVLLPTSLSEIPAIAITTKAAQNIYLTAQRLSEGGAIGTTLLEGLAHNSVNRPLAGLATSFLGYRTTGKGNLLLVQNDFANETMWWSKAAAIMGGKTLDEGIVTDTLYRKIAYDAARTADLQVLGSALKTKIRAGQEITSEDVTEFMGRYARKGGNLEQFNKWMINSMKDANSSQIEQIRTTLSTPASRTMMDIIGTDRATSYTLIPQAAAPIDQSQEGQGEIDATQALQ